MQIYKKGRQVGILIINRQGRRKGYTVFIIVSPLILVTSNKRLSMDITFTWMHFTASKIEALQQETDNIFNVLKILVYRKIDNIFEIKRSYQI